MKALVDGEAGREEADLVVGAERRGESVAVAAIGQPEETPTDGRFRWRPAVRERQDVSGVAAAAPVLDAQAGPADRQGLDPAGRWAATHEDHRVRAARPVREGAAR